MLAIIAIALFLSFMLIQSVLHRMERKDLYNRMMARDYTEYTQHPKKLNDEEVITRKKHGTGWLMKSIDRAYNGINGKE